MLTAFTTILAAVLFAYLGFIVLALMASPRLLFPVPPAGYSADDFPALELPSGQQIRISYLPLPSARTLILYHHGNGEDLASLQKRLHGFHEHGYAVFAYDYPGYGHSSGKPSERGVLDAAENVTRHLAEVHGWHPQDVVHYGHSLGGAPAIYMGMVTEARAVVVEGAFTGVTRLITRWRLLPWEPFNNLFRVRKLRVPLLVIHGTEDRTVPWWCGRQLLAQARAQTACLWVEGARHADLWEVAGPRFWKVLADFTEGR